MFLRRLQPSLHASPPKSFMSSINLSHTSGSCLTWSRLCCLLCPPFQGFDFVFDPRSMSENFNVFLSLPLFVSSLRTGLRLMSQLRLGATLGPINYFSWCTLLAAATSIFLFLSHFTDRRLPREMGLPRIPRHPLPFETESPTISSVSHFSGLSPFQRVGNPFRKMPAISGVFAFSLRSVPAPPPSVPVTPNFLGSI